MILKPDQESGLLRSGKALLVNPMVVGSHVRIHERPGVIELRRSRSRKQFVHRLLLLTGSKPDHQRERLGSPQRLARSPLREGSAEDLSAGTLSEQLKLEAIQYFISRLIHAEAGWSQAGKMRAQLLRAHAGLPNFRLHIFQQSRTHWIQRLIRNAGQLRAVICLDSTVNVPVS